jgi:hypothetical protein
VAAEAEVVVKVAAAVEVDLSVAIVADTGVVAGEGFEKSRIF